MSIRSFSRLGSSLSVYTTAHVHNTLKVGASKILQSGQDLSFYALASGNRRALRLFDDGSNAGGHLHGTWTSDSSVTASDRRKKFDINPLFRELLKLSPAQEVEQATKLIADGQVTHAQEQTVMQVLGKLRPVSYKYKHAAESKYSRYGFIAQEIEEVLPSIVHKSPQDGMLSLRLDDLIAVVTLGIQSVDSRVMRLDEKLLTVKEKVDSNYMDVSERLRGIETAIRKMVLSAKKKQLAAKQNATIAAAAEATAKKTLDVVAVPSLNGTSISTSSGFTAEQRDILVKKIQTAVIEVMHKTHDSSSDEDDKHIVAYEEAKREISKFVLDEIARKGEDASLLQQKELLSTILEEALDLHKKVEADKAADNEEFSSEEKAFFHEVLEYAREKLAKKAGAVTLERKDEIYA
jgi:hypothetical protein